MTLFCSWALGRVAYEWNFPAVWGYRSKLIQGWGLTLGLSLLSLFCSSLFGLLAALSRKSSVLILRSGALLYTELIRGTPLLVQILLLYYGIANAVGLSQRFIAGVLILSCFSGAYLSEIFRAGMESVSSAQLESARSLGMNRRQLIRWLILPQALRQVLPPMTGQCVSLIKDSSLLSIIGLQEFTLSAREVNSYTYSTLEAYLPLALGYLLLTLPLSMLARWLEKRMQYAT